jgi:two-component system chemotaxis response regulator CheB
MPGHDIIVVAASAGGVETLCKLASGLPPDLPAAVFVVLHIPPHATSFLPSILSRAGPLPAAHPNDGQAIEHGRIYVAPPDSHLLVKRGHIHLGHGPRENGHRPAADPLFRTAARAYGPRVVGVVLSGNLDDGTAGLLAVKVRGGVAIVQDPSEALYSGMPASASENVAVDWVLPVSEMAALLARLALEPVEEKPAEAVSKDIEIESDMAELDIHPVRRND